MTKALVIGDDTRAFLACVRSLARSDVVVHVAPWDFASPALHSRYIAGIHRLPPYSISPHAWLKALRDIIVDNGITFILPCDERSLLPIAQHRSVLGELAKLGIPGDESIDVLFDKQKTRELGQSLGLPLAPGFFGSPSSPEFARGLSNIDYPVFVKPPCSYTLESLGSRGKVNMFRSEGEVRAFLEQADDRAVIVESLVPGIGVGVSVLAEDGEIKLAFQHQRVHPLRSGGSGYRRSARLDAEMLALCEKVTRSLRYTGLAMFEFRVDAGQNRYWLLEVNARPWGSLPLSVALGVDFPIGLYRLHFKMPLKSCAIASYRVGVYGRNWSSDSIYLKEGLSDRRNSIARSAGFALSYLAGYLRNLIGLEKSDTLVLDDWRPAWMELRTLATWYKRRRNERSAFGQYASLPNLVAKAARLREVGQLSVIFVCRGNICRSPFAAALMTKLCADSISTGIKVSSAGCYPATDRCPPATASLVAKAFDIDISRHASFYFNEALMNSADLVVIFDKRNFADIESMYPSALKKLVFLSSVYGSTDGIAEFKDPYGGDEGHFRSSYNEISAAVEKLFGILMGANRAHNQL